MLIISVEETKVRARSAGTKENKSSAWKAKKRARHFENLDYRRSLHMEKQSYGDPEKRNQVQLRIDEISKRK